jgi:hypothetical protein
MMKVLLLTAILIIMLSCSDNVNNNDNLIPAVITGPDYRDCVCCGGWIILIDSINYNFDRVPEGSSINLDNEKFPLNVNVLWMVDTIPCGNRILLKKLQKR